MKKTFFILTFILVGLFCTAAFAGNEIYDAIRGARTNIVWENPSPQGVPEELAREIKEANTILNSHDLIVHTPLRRLDKISKISGKEVYIKDDSLQNSGSFKMRGVSYEAYRAVESYINRIKGSAAQAVRYSEKPFFIVVQGEGNSGIAAIQATAFIIESYLKLYPELATYIKNIEPVVFTINNLPEEKYYAMLKALMYYRSVVNDNNKGLIANVYKSYKEAEEARMAFVKQNSGSAVYMERGGIEMICGQGSLGIELNEDLEKIGIGGNKRVAIIVPVGSGSLVGMVAGIKTSRPDAMGVIVQTVPYSAFIKSLINGGIERNPSNPDPTVLIEGRPVVFEDGIAVDTPEMKAVELARKFVDCGVVVDDQKNLLFAAPLLRSDLSRYSGSLVSGTSSATLEALLEYPDIKSIKGADIVVLLGTEGNVDSAVTKYINSVDGLKARD